MSRETLENVKVGDRVWVGSYTRRAEGSVASRWNYRVVEGVSAKQFRVKGGARFRKANGRSATGDAGQVLSIATPDEIETWEAEKTAKKAAAEAAEAERERAEQEKRGRMKEVFRCVSAWENAELAEDRITFTLDGHRYEIRAID